MKSAQEILNEVVQHIRAQGRQSNAAGPGSSCRYRSPDGLKCVVGCLIPDEHYTPAIEGRSVKSAAVGLVLMDLGLKQHEALLQTLQRAHDAAWGGHEMDDFHMADWSETPPFVTVFEGRARLIAKEHGLEYPA